MFAVIRLNLELAVLAGFAPPHGVGVGKGLGVDFIPSVVEQDPVVPTINGPVPAGLVAEAADDKVVDIPSMGAAEPLVPVVVVDGIVPEVAIAALDAEDPP